MRGVCVLGLGLIGGSLLRAAVASGRTAFGATESKVDARAAAADGYQVDELPVALKRAADEDALVVIAVPLTSVDSVLAAIGQHAPTAMLTDVVSVKRPVHDSVRRRLPRARYVGGHPMAGATASGWAAGSAALFDGATWVVSTVDGVALEVWTEVAGLALDAGATVLPADPDEHDEAAARVSHLPHLFASVLASVGADSPLALAMAAGSFADGTRDAGSRPE
ncbi:MAG: prephenate dehydrogenase/arogenate dehydrogenase family protein, partial [Sciscionella sp.]|nr:prephenate dehydrogenase/arogenate dehydrogenase family protein [Sciscionella sp.]